MNIFLQGIKSSTYPFLRWTDRRILIDQEKLQNILKKGEDPFTWVPVDVSFIKEFWLPDAEILNLKEFKTLGELSNNNKNNSHFSSPSSITSSHFCHMKMLTFSLNLTSLA